jgi:hypothetical protein
LLVAAAPAWCRQMKDFAPNHRSSRLRWREFCHLLSHQPHFLTVGFVGGETEDLVAQDRADAPPRGSLAKRRAHRFAVGQSLGAHNLERRDARVIEPYVE